MAHTESGVRIEFEMYPIVNAIKSKEAGREVCDEKPHVRIRNAGEDKHEFFGPVNDQIKARFPDEWERFQKGMEIHASGTPVDRWPQLTHAQIRTLKSLNFYSVEDVATASDAAIQRYGMGGQKLRTDAQRFLSLAQAAADVAQLDELKEAVTQRDLQITAMSSQLDAMQKLLEKLSKPEATDRDAARAAPKRKVKAE
jgi:uncharacterized coiled-coil protein SlyX